MCDKLVHTRALENTIININHRLVVEFVLEQTRPKAKQYRKMTHFCKTK